jgi:hypothetical protein
MRIIILLIVLILLTGCKKKYEKDFDNVLKENTVESYENYIEIYERQNVRAAREFVKIAQENLLKLLKENPELISKVRHGHGRLKSADELINTYKQIKNNKNIKHYQDFVLKYGKHKEAEKYINELKEIYEN